MEGVPFSNTLTVCTHVSCKSLTTVRHFYIYSSHTLYICNIVTVSLICLGWRHSVVSVEWSYLLVFVIVYNNIIRCLKQNQSFPNLRHEGQTWSWWTIALCFSVLRMLHSDDAHYCLTGQFMFSEYTPFVHVCALRSLIRDFFSHFYIKINWSVKFPYDSYKILQVLG